MNKQWFSLHSVPDVRQYNSSNNLSFQAILLLNNAPGYSQSLHDFYWDIKVTNMFNSAYGLISPSYPQAGLLQKGKQPGH
jgi:hypothetical protein